MANHADSYPLIPPPITQLNEIDHETGPGEQIQCRICLETDGRDFIAPCKCKETSKYIHWECLDQWRAVRVQNIEGFAFAHCTGCKTMYHLRVHVLADRKCLLVATMVGQRIWQRHYHILAKRMLIKEYVVEDVDGEMSGSEWSSPPFPPEHVQQLKTLGLL